VHDYVALIADWSMDWQVTDLSKQSGTLIIIVLSLSNNDLKFFLQFYL